MKTYRFTLSFALVSVLMSACSDSGNAPARMIGLQGQVYSVATPGHTPIDWVPPPLERVSTILVLDSNHKFILELLTDNKGRFTVEVEPRTYYLRVKESMIPSETGPYVVKAGKLLSVRAHHDGGMR